jgi:hypothetical protein
MPDSSRKDHRYDPVQSQEASAHAPFPSKTSAPATEEIWQLFAGKIRTVTAFLWGCGVLLLHCYMCMLRHKPVFSESDAAYVRRLLRCDELDLLCPDRFGRLLSPLGLIQRTVTLSKSSTEEETSSIQQRSSRQRGSRQSSKDLQIHTSITWTTQISWQPVKIGGPDAPAGKPATHTDGGVQGTTRDLTRRVLRVALARKRDAKYWYLLQKLSIKSASKTFRKHHHL